ncbi:MAG: twin-arginine translocase TatA/TatE family subunit [Nitrospirota bacterium]
MLDIGMPELILVFIVILIVFGPGKIPEFSKALGRGIREIKLALRGVKESVEEAVSQGEQGITGMIKPDILHKERKAENTMDIAEKDKSLPTEQAGAETDEKKGKAVDG